MRSGNRDDRVNRSLFSLKGYLGFFGLNAFVVSACFLLFLHYMDFSFEGLRKGALLTFGNVLLLSLLCTVVDGLRRKFTIQRPVRRILDATHRLTQGDFSARIEPLHRYGRKNELDIIIEDFNKMAGELSGVETLRTDFISNVSHELKTPLSVINNYSVMLGAPGLTDEKRIEYAGIAARASRNLSTLITNILKLNKLENQQIFPQMAEYDLAEQLRECVLGFESIWDKKEIEIDLEEIDDNVFIRADRELLGLVWNNLISNAMKFTKQSGTVAVSLKADREYVIVRVSDTGCGIAPEVGQHIFEKFYQGDSSHAEQGNGLGLALVKRVVDIVDGEIAVESAPGTGSTFIVKLRKML